MHKLAEIDTEGLGSKEGGVEVVGSKAHKLAMKLGRNFVSKSNATPLKK